MLEPPAVDFQHYVVAAGLGGGAVRAAAAAAAAAAALRRCQRGLQRRRVGVLAELEQAEAPDALVFAACRLVGAAVRQIGAAQRVHGHDEFLHIKQHATSMP